MFVAIANTPRDYAWGSLTAMSELLGTVPSGRPEAELWLGAHPGSPSRIVEPDAVGGAQDLAAWIDSDRVAALGERTRLPFLMKVLTAGSPLSLQAHPSPEQAAAGFERENAVGIPIDAPQRNYRDAYSKPELIFALSDTFEALCGFRPAAEAREVFLALGLDELVPRLHALPELFAWLMGGGQEVDDLVGRVSGLAKAVPERVGDRSPTVMDALDTVALLTRSSPGDAGIVAALLLNRVTLRRGEALYLPAGNIHAYLRGDGIEIMTASDNVLRGGLTPKHVDVDELMRVLDFSQGPPPWSVPETRSSTLAVFRPGNDDFILAHSTGAGILELTGPAIAVCTSGTMRMEGSRGARSISRGESVYVTADESPLSLTGAGEVFLGTTP